jgi:hypothetical protein
MKRIKQTLLLLCLSTGFIVRGQDIKLLAGNSIHDLSSRVDHYVISGSRLMQDTGDIQNSQDRNESTESNSNKRSVHFYRVISKTHFLFHANPDFSFAQPNNNMFTRSTFEIEAPKQLLPPVTSTAFTCYIPNSNQPRDPVQFSFGLYVSSRLQKPYFAHVSHTLRIVIASLRNSLRK